MKTKLNQVGQFLKYWLLLRIVVKCCDYEWVGFSLYIQFSSHFLEADGRETENELHLIRLIELWGEGWFFFQ